VACGLQALSGVGAGQGAGQVIDTHIHLFDPRRPQGVPWPPKTDASLYRPVLPDEFEALVRPEGVTGAVIVEASPWLEDNQWVLDLARDNPFLVGVVGNLQADGFARNLERFRKNPLFRGIRLGGGAIVKGATNPEFQENLRRLADADLSLDAIGNTDMIVPLTRLLDRIPSLRVALDHMPGEPVGWRTQETSRKALAELAKRPQVFAKVSGVLQRAGESVPTDLSVYKAALDDVWGLFGAERVMYGSNWPVSDRMGTYKSVIKVMRDYLAQRGAGDAGRYFASNSKACYKWVDRG